MNNKHPYANLHCKVFKAKYFVLYKYFQNKLKLEIPKVKNIWAHKWNVALNCLIKTSAEFDI